MFIPIVKTKIKENDTVILIKDFNLSFGIFTKGHLFVVKSILNNKYLLVDENNYTIQVDEHYICKNITIEESSDIDKYNKNKQKILSSISNSCKMKCNGWDKYEHYYKCQLKKSTYLHDDICNVKLSCVKYCDEDTSNKLLNKIRYLKLNKIKNKIK